MQHCVIIDADKSLLHCFTYHIDVELKACQLALLLSAAFQGRIILALLTISLVWAKSQPHTSEAQSSVRSALCRLTGNVPNDADDIFLERCLKLINRLIMMGKNVSTWEQGDGDISVCTHYKQSRQS